jgi:hypothetical protein
MENILSKSSDKMKNMKTIANPRGFREFELFPKGFTQKTANIHYFDATQFKGYFIKKHFQNEVLSLP